MLPLIIYVYYFLIIMILKNNNSSLVKIKMNKQISPFNVFIITSSIKVYSWGFTYKITLRECRFLLSLLIALLDQIVLQTNATLPPYGENEIMVPLLCSTKLLPLGKCGGSLKLECFSVV